MLSKEKLLFFDKTLDQNFSNVSKCFNISVSRNISITDFLIKTNFSCLDFARILHYFVLFYIILKILLTYIFFKTEISLSTISISSKLLTRNLLLSPGLSASWPKLTIRADKFSKFYKEFLISKSKIKNKVTWTNLAAWQSYYILSYFLKFLIYHPSTHWTLKIFWYLDSRGKPLHNCLYWKY